MWANLYTPAMQATLAAPAAPIQNALDVPPATWSDEAARASVLMLYQGRRKTWLHQALGISRVYLYRIMLQPGEPQHSATPAGFWWRVADLLGVPQHHITRGLPPDSPVVAWATQGLPADQAAALRARLVK
jgi:hypothetical protein